jgi:hypothetical protein
MISYGTLSQSMLQNWCMKFIYFLVAPSILCENLKMFCSITAVKNIIVQAALHYSLVSFHCKSGKIFLKELIIFLFSSLYCLKQNVLHLKNFLQTSYKLLMTFLQTSYKLLTNFLQTSYKCLTNILQTSYKRLTNFLQTFYKLLTNFLQTSYKLLTNFLQTSYKLLTLILTIKETIIFGANFL